MTVEVLSFGCRLNLAEGEAIRVAAGAQPLTVINSCAVTNEAVRQTRQAIRRARRARPDRRLLVTGCAAQLDPAAFAAMPEVDAVIDNHSKLRPESYSNALSPGGATRTASGGGASDALDPVVSGRSHARAFVEVQTGCDHRCTFCIIPHARGPSRSLSADRIVAAIARAVDGGQREVVLTGVDVTSYAGGLGPLVARILADVPDLPRLRLSSLDPMEVDDTLFDLLAHHPRVMPHLHLSLQAGDDLTLKRMARRHRRTDAIALVTRLKARRPALAIGADLIAGFPTETDAMFAQTLAILDDCDVVLPHIFPYSARTGTPAARMPQVVPATIRARAATLRTRAAARKAAWLAALDGTLQHVLVERDGLTGHVENFAPVTLAAPAPRHAILPVRVTFADGRLIGSPA